jgi:serine protease AprX
MKKIASFLLVGALTCMAGTSKSKVSSDLASAVQTNSIQVVVQWNIEPGAATAQKISALGGTVVSEFPSVHSGLYSIPSSALNTLSADPDVKYVSPDRDLRKKSTIKTVGPVAATINAPYMWGLGYTGAGIGVAVVDSGINQDDNLGLGKDHAPVYSEDFTGLMPKKKSGSKGGGMSPDWYGHGQHIAGIIASNAKESNCDKCNKSFVGIAPNVSLINLKVLDANGEGSDSAVIAAISRAISLKSTYNIRVMNLSLGRPVYESYAEDPLCQAVEAAWKAGIVVVVAAGNEGRDNTFGNEGYGTINAPGNDPYVITVGAMKDMGTSDRSDDLIASYSSKGPTAVDHVVKPDILAPGNQVVSLLAEHGTLGLSDPQNILTISSYQDGAPSVGSIPVQPSYDSGARFAQPPNVKIGPGYSKRYYIDERDQHGCRGGQRGSSGSTPGCS